MSEFIVTDEQKEIWKVEKQILIEFMRVCDENDLKYFVAHGTLLGAIRHKGFIPWDDDIDVNMPRADYEKLKSIAPKVFKEPYFFQCFESDPNSFWGCGKLRYDKSTGIDLQDIGIKTNNGLFIDVFPMDNVIDDLRLRKKQSRKIELYRNLLRAKIYGKYYESYLYIDSKKWRLYKLFCRLFSANWLNEKFEMWVEKYNDVNTERSGIIAFKTDYECCYWYKEDYEELINLGFEDIVVPAPSNYDRCLRIKWGDYMKLPPENQRGKKHDDVLMDAKTPYANYDVSKFIWSIKDLKRKKVVLFGKGRVAADFYKKHGKKIDIFLVIDNAAKEQENWNGIRVLSPREYIKDEEKTIVIAARDFKNMGKQLERMNISDYYVYIQGRIY